MEAPVPQPGEGELLARTLYLSVDPYMRGRMNDVKSYAPPVQIGEVMVGGTVSRVSASNHPDSPPARAFLLCSGAPPPSRGGRRQP